jgi:hypothetical protein
MLGMVETYHGHQDQLPFTPDNGQSVEPEVLPTLPLDDRLRTVHEIAGFYGTSRREVNEAMGLLDETSPFGAAQHLNEVLQPQLKSVSEDPQAAVRSITDEYGAYARKARADVTALGTLREELAYLHPVTGARDESRNNHPFAGIDRDAVHTGLGQFVRYFDLATLSEGTGKFDPFKFDNPGRKPDGTRRKAYDQYTVAEPEPEVAAHIEEVLGRTRLYAAKLLTEAAIVNEQNRYGFWVGKLQESKRHLAARSVAVQALSKLGIHE